MKKKRPKEPEARPMKCAVCNECYESQFVPGRCHFGGPFSGYIREGD